MFNKKEKREMKQTERILLYSDKQKAALLDRNVEAVCNASNDLIRIFESFQSFERITTIEQAEQLFRDPKEKMDSVLVKQINPDMIKNASKLNPRTVAELMGIEYDNYLRVLSGETVDPSTCKPCKAAPKVIKGKGVISFREYEKYSRFLTFSESRFMVDEVSLSEEKEQFNYYAETPDQIKERDFWHGACDVLNQLHNRGCLGGDLNSLSKTLNGLMTFSYNTAKLTVDDAALYNRISNLK